MFGSDNCKTQFRFINASVLTYYNTKHAIHLSYSTEAGEIIVSFTIVTDILHLFTIPL